MDLPGNENKVNKFCEGSLKVFSVFVCLFVHFLSLFSSLSHSYVFLALCRGNKDASLLLKLVHACLWSRARGLCTGSLYQSCKIDLSLLALIISEKVHALIFAHLT